MKEVRYTPWWMRWLPSMLLGALLAMSLAFLHILFGTMKEEARASLYLEISKTLLQLIGVLILGSLVSLAIKQLDNSRKADKALHEFRIEFLKHLADFDDVVQTARSALRSQGLTNQFSGALTVLSANQIVAYDSAVGKLYGVKTGINRIRQEISNFPGSISRGDAVKLKLDNMYRFIQNVVLEYEHARPRQEIPFNTLVWLNNFTGRPVMVGVDDPSYDTWKKDYTATLIFIREDLLPLKSVIDK